MKIKSFLQWICIAGCAVIVIFVSFGVQSQTKAPKIKMDSIPVIRLLPDTLLPDTTQQKVDLLFEKVKELDTAVRIDSIKVVKEVQETKLVKSNSAVLEFVANKVDADPIPTPEIKPKTLAYPDTITIVLKSERKSIFKRKKWKRKNN